MGAPWRGLSTAKLAKNSRARRHAWARRWSSSRPFRAGPVRPRADPAAVRRETYCHSSLACRRHIDRVGAARAAFFRSGGCLGSAPTDRQAGGVLAHACIVFRLAAAFAALVLVQEHGQREQRWPRPSTNQGLTNQDAAAAFSSPAYLRQITDTGGLRSKLEQDGVRFTFKLLRRRLRQPGGGVKQGPGYDGRFGTIIDADLQKLIGWSGATFHASIHQIHGTQFSAVNLDNLTLVSGIEAPTSTRLFNLWIEQQFAIRSTSRVSQFTAAQEFMVSDNADLFVNSTFGWPLPPPPICRAAGRIIRKQRLARGCKSPSPITSFLPRRHL